jgi:hypothetical protein
MGVDFIKYPYRVPCRFTTDPHKWSEIQWTFADDNALCLPFGSAICNLCLEDDKGAYDNPIGELWDGYGRRLHWVTLPAGITGQRFCGTALEFTQGQTFDPDAPAPVYGANGWLLCCGQIPVVYGGAGGGGHLSPVVQRPILAYGGAAAGGECSVSVIAIDAPSGGGRGGGTVAETLTYRDAPSGGGSGGGAVLDYLHTTDAPMGGGAGGGTIPDTLLYTDAPSGGGAGGGSVAEQLAYTDAPTGGGAGGGSLSERVTYVDTPAGGGAGGGGVAEQIRYVDSPVGGGQGGGAVSEEILYTDALDGGGSGGGTVADALAYVDAPSGGGSGGGDVADVYTPGGPTPGATCAAAGSCALSTVYSFNGPSGSNQQWLVWTGVPSGGHTFHLTNIGSGAYTGVYYTGTTCGSLGSASALNSPITALLVFSGVVYVEITAGSGTGSYSIELV